MITKKEATRITADFLKKSEIYNEGFFVASDHIEDKGFAWYVPFGKHKSNLDTLLVSAYQGLIIDKFNGETMQPGSAYTLDKWLFGFKIGLRGGRYDLKITKVFNHQKALEMIYRMQLQYVRIEIENGTEWKIPKAFNKTVINERLQKLPCIFKNQGLAFQIDTFKQILEEQLFEYQLEPTQNENLKIIGELL